MQLGMMNVYLICDSSVSSSQQVAVASEVLRVNSPLLRSFPWHTGVVLKLPTFLGHVGAENLDVSLKLLPIHSQSTLIKQQLFLSTLDKSETTLLFTMAACVDPQDYDVQSMLGIKVDGVRNAVSSRANVLVETLGTARAGFLFSVLARYRLVDVVALVEGLYPNPVPVPRSPAPTGSIPVCQILVVFPLFFILNFPVF